MTLAVKQRINWKHVIDVVIEILDEFKAQEVEQPTLRAIFYQLVDNTRKTLPNTINAYKDLSDALVKAKKDGRIAWDAIADEERKFIQDFQSEYETPQEYADRGIYHLKSADIRYHIPRWHNQKHYVEIWVEKNTQSGIIKAFLEDREVAICANKGFSSWSFMYDNCERLKEQIAEGKQVHILYLGDFDPSGDAMDSHMKKTLLYFGLKTRTTEVTTDECEEVDLDLSIDQVGEEFYSNYFNDKYTVNFQRIGITLSQIEELDLPHMPTDSKTLEKLDKDSRTNSFVQKHGQLYAVELDALLSRPEVYRKLIQNSVDRYFDKGIYLHEQSKHSKDNIRGLVAERIKTEFNIPDSVGLNDTIIDSMNDND